MSEQLILGRTTEEVTSLLEDSIETRQKVDEVITELNINVDKIKKADGYETEVLGTSGWMEICTRIIMLANYLGTIRNFPDQCDRRPHSVTSSQIVDAAPSEHNGVHGAPGTEYPFLPSSGVSNPQFVNEQQRESAMEALLNGFSVFCSGKSYVLSKIMLALTTFNYGEDIQFIERAITRLREIRKQVTLPPELGDRISQLIKKLEETARVKGGGFPEKKETTKVGLIRRLRARLGG